MCHYIDTNRRRKEKHKERKDLILSLKGRVCAHCGQTYPDICFDLHHVDPSKKEFQFNQLYAHSIEAILAEIEKCILLCSNCHRIEHGRMRKQNDI